MDSWQTYVLNVSLTTNLIPSALRSGVWKEHFAVGLVSLLPFIVIDAFH